MGQVSSDAVRLFHELQSSGGFSGPTLSISAGPLPSAVFFLPLSPVWTTQNISTLPALTLSFYRVLRASPYTAENLPYLTRSLPGCEILSTKKTPQINEFFLMLLKSGPIDKAPSKSNPMGTPLALAGTCYLILAAPLAFVSFFPHHVLNWD